ncbi:MAG: aminotransferase class III-fold pyridoxal phosphate-dependent enzyme, partial [Candidatus ainarchaeum sp.]|nr:aminotransferase class III-fold pyridoxal phosphate-dependent enzyme [Candidatus ainarchaeum sp.]
LFPYTFPDGLDSEVFPFRILERAWKEARLQSEREHVTPYIWQNPQKFKMFSVTNKEDLSRLRWCVDEKEDFDFVSEIIKRLGADNISFGRIMKLLKKSPELMEINRKFSRNEGYAKSLRDDKMKEKKITNFKKSLELLEKAKKLIPSASQTYSKSYNYYCEGVAPVFLDRGLGSHVWDLDGNEFIDFVCALGAVTIGYNNRRINDAIKAQLDRGMTFSLPTKLEVDLAEKLSEIIPCAEMSRFVKNGSDATSAAVRLARAHTGREMIARCGYHGFQDWYIGSTENSLGVPKAVQALTTTFNYNDIGSLEKAFEKNRNKIAAVIMEPCQGNGPEKGFLEKVKKITHENCAVLVFDEVVSGFRMALGGAEEYYKVTPDLASFGKGMANGASISAIAGQREILGLIDKGAFISMTFGGETVGLTAALETIKILEKPGSFRHIWAIGEALSKGLRELIEKKGLSDAAEVNGLPPHCGIVFRQKGPLSSHDLLSVYQQRVIEKGILSLGGNNFCLSHTKEEAGEFISASDIALDDVKKAIEAGGTKGILRGGKFRPVFKR